MQRNDVFGEELNNGYCVIAARKVPFLLVSIGM